MVLNSEKEMHIACEQWLQVRESFMTGAGIQHLEEYRAASERLFAAFVRDFGIEDFAVLARAFKSFRWFLVRSGDGPRTYPAWSPKNGLRTSC
jgi:hypothetical protein